MSWKHALAWPMHRIREALGLYAYTLMQTYALEYCVSLHAGSTGSATIAIPLPPDTTTQTVRALTVLVEDAHEIRDTLYGNRILLMRMDTRQGVSRPVFRCRVVVKPRTVTPPAPAPSDGAGRPPLTLRGGEHELDTRITALAEQIGRGSGSRDTARRINDYLVEHLNYGDPIDGLSRDVAALTRARVDCGGFVSLFVSLCAAQDIPARIVAGFWLDGDKNDMHAWAEFQDETGDWIPVDPSVEQLARQGRTHKSGRCGFVGSDRLTISHGHDIPITWNNKIMHAPILQHPFVLEGNVACRGEIRCYLPSPLLSKKGNILC